MPIKKYRVHSEILDEHWEVDAYSVKGAIIETLSLLKRQLVELERQAGKDIDIDLKVSEIKEK
jgi:hypothetical protein